MLTEGLVWAAVGLDPARLRVELIVQSASEEAAARLAAHLPKRLGGMYEGTPEAQKQVARKTFELFVSLARPTVEGDRVIVRINGGE